MTGSMSPAELEEFIRSRFPAADFPIRVLGTDDASVRAEFQVAARHLRPDRIVSGPTLMFFADCIAYLLVLHQYGPIGRAVTTQLNIHFLRATPPDNVCGVAKVLRASKRSLVSEVILTPKGSEDVVAHATVTYAILAGG